MATYEATFDIETKADAYAVEKLLERLYDSVREESRTRRPDTTDSTATLTEFEELREAADRHSPGRLTVTYEQYDDQFASPSE
ncbi:MAG: hypothetical protein ACOCY7_04325 [Halodesulfurarchaeum sp.]